MYGNITAPTCYAALEPLVVCVAKKNQKVIV